MILLYSINSEPKKVQLSDADAALFLYKRIGDNVTINPADTLYNLKITGASTTNGTFVSKSLQQIGFKKSSINILLKRLST